MKLCRLLFSIGLLIGLSAPCEGIFSGTSLQEYIDSYIDVAQYHLDGILSLNDSAISQIWDFFKTKYGRIYSSFDEEKQRLRIFRDHLQYVVKSNLERFRTFELELNDFADWTNDEFNLLKKGLIVSPTSRRDITDDDSVRRSLEKLYQHHHHLRRVKRNLNRRRYKDKRFFFEWFSNLFGGDKTPPTDILDWRTKSKVSSVKNQLKCGGCYGFATAAIMETLYVMKTKSDLIDFSPQQIIDCSSDGNNGCAGGNFPPSVRYLMKQGGKIATHASYPYVGKKQDCRTNGVNLIQLGNIEYFAIPEGDEVKMVEALTNFGPLFIGVDAETKLFMFYKTGVLKVDNCPNRRQEMDHAMVIVGHGYDNALKMPYWIIKNSWGPKWGESGYLRLAKDAGNMCGVASMAHYAKLT